MNQGIIIYRSKYGATKKYADWLTEITDFDCKEVSKGTLDIVEQYETIILCGGIYASGIAGLSFLKKNIVRLKDKKIFDEGALKEIKEHNMTGDLQEVPLFYGRGMWDESRMTFIDRNLCKLLQKSVAKKDPKTYEPWMKALISAVGQTCDWTNKNYLTPLLESMESLT